MLRRERRAVHPRGEQEVGPQRLVEREAALVVLLLAALQAVVEPLERDVDGAGLEARLLQQGRERRPGPPRRADRAVAARAG